MRTPGQGSIPIERRLLTDEERARRAKIQRDGIEKALSDKWVALSGTPGEPRVPGEAGLLWKSGNYYREYANGSLYYIKSTVYAVYGAIGQRYAQLGGPDSWLGWPTSDEQDFAQGGRANSFEHGSIYWWSDTGAIELGQVAVRYKGLYCFGETDGELSGSDEPYFIFGVVPVPPAQKSSVRSPIYGQVDAGNARPDNIEIYRGLPYGLAMVGVLMEHDFGDPEKFKEQVKQGVDATAKGVAFAVQHIPIVGPTLAKVAEPVLKEVAPHVVKAVNDLLHTQDDHISTHEWQITARDMVILTRAARNNLWGIEWHLDSPLFSGDGSSYKAYFDIQAV